MLPREENCDFTFYQVQARYKRHDPDTYEGRWFYHTHCNMAKSWLPNRNGRIKHRWSDDNIFNSSGTVWQNYGYNGVLNLKTALRWMTEVVEYHAENLEDPDMECEFRVAKIHITRKTETCYTMSLSKKGG